ncbi:MAG: MarR family transcriptional regulator [Deltaproteobacteria bacterium]|nr:MarR family transcriptional regulator [Deltaproteobacteria bacterium]
MGDKDKSLSRTIYFLAQDLQNLAQRILKPYDITLEQFHLLKVLSHKNTNLTQKEICQKAYKTPGNITRILDRLEGKSLVSRRSNPDDRRAIIVTLTRKGQDLLQEADVVFKDFSSRLHSGIDTKTQVIMKRAVGRLNTNVARISKEVEKKAKL